ncbi:hypothetical protein EV1_000999 [Malus domestica]
MVLPSASMKETSTWPIESSTTLSSSGSHMDSSGLELLGTSLTEGRRKVGALGVAHGLVRVGFEGRRNGGCGLGETGFGGKGRLGERVQVAEGRRKAGGDWFWWLE